MALKDRGKKAIENFIENRAFFKHETLEGTHMLFGLGQLPEPYRSQLTNLDMYDDIDRVLYSYKTPIAWRTKEGVWIVPSVSYSRTTTNHQATIIKMLS